MNLKKIFKDFESRKVLIIGDIMIDSYMWGEIKRQSPEAPVPIVNITKKENRLGGAGNVALNIKSLGATPILCSVIGKDKYGEELIKLMKKEKLEIDSILIDNNRKTTVKTRIINNQEHVLRVDEENIQPIKKEKELIKKIELFINHVDVVILQDYNKGVLTKKVIKYILKRANILNIPTIVDPKKENFQEYKKCTLFKPNLLETMQGMNININPKNIQSIKKAASKLRSLIKSKDVLITLSENGICLDSKEVFLHIPAYKRNIIDISGAGDTVISVAALCKSINIKNEILCVLSNLAGGLVCEYAGVVRINKEILLKEAENILVNE